MALFRLAYVSTSLLSEDPVLKERQIDAILFISRRNNESVQVTGALLATEHHFAQVLEGERADVEETYERIRRDRRHKDVVPIIREPIEARQFPEWSMAHIGPSQSAEQAVAGLANYRRPGVARKPVPCSAS